MDKDFENIYMKIKHKNHVDDLKLSHSKFDIFTNKDNLEFIETKSNFKYFFNGLNDIKYNTSTGKLFMYAVSKLPDNKNVAKFYIPNYLKIRGFSDNRDGKKQLNNDIIALSCLSGVYGKIDGLIQYQPIILSIKTFDCNQFLEVKFNEEFVNCIKGLYFWLPKSLYSSKDRYAPHSWSIGYEVFRYLKNNNVKKDTHNRTIESLIDTSNLQNIKDTDRQKQLLYSPFIKSLVYLNNIQNSVEIEIPDYKPNFYKDKIKIKVKDNRLLECYSTKKATIESNRLNKQSNIKQAKRLKKQGLTTQEIAVKLNKSTRTIARYLN